MVYFLATTRFKNKHNRKTSSLDRCGMVTMLQQAWNCEEKNDPVRYEYCTFGDFFIVGSCRIAVVGLSHQIEIN